MFLVDTRIVLDARRGRREAADWLRSVDPGAIYLSVITLGEIQRGVELRRRTNADAAERLEQWLETLRSNYSSRVLPITHAIAIEWGRIAAGRNRGVAETWIAATAIAHKLTLATRNVADFDDLALKIVNPGRAA